MKKETASVKNNLAKTHDAYPASKQIPIEAFAYKPRENNYFALQWYGVIAAEIALLVLAVYFFPIPCIGFLTVYLAGRSLYEFFTKPKKTVDTNDCDPAMAVRC